MSTTLVPASASDVHDSPSVRAILRVVVTVVLSVLALYLIYLVRTPVR